MPALTRPTQKTTLLSYESEEKADEDLLMCVCAMQLPLSTFYDYSVDQKWIAERAPPESSWRFFAHGHARCGTGD